MRPHDRLKDRIARSSDRQIGTAALLLLASVAAIDILLIAGAVWISYAIIGRTHGTTQIVGLVLSALVLCCALLVTWRVTRGYRNLRRLIDDARNGR